MVLDEPAAVVDGEPDERTGLRRLYVALTRAVSGLIVTHTAPLPRELSLQAGGHPSRPAPERQRRCSPACFPPTRLGTITGDLEPLGAGPHPPAPVGTPPTPARVSSPSGV